LRRTDRRPQTNSDNAIAIDNLSIFPDKRVVTVDGKPVDLRMKEFDLLLTLAEHCGMVFSREKLLNVVWGYDFAGETRTVDVHVAHLRHKLEGMRPQIETVWGVGYKLDA
jgi:two-component system, OmpR family, alkaline phosphatase synthesis response regulator PhoP